MTPRSKLATAGAAVVFAGLLAAACATWRGQPALLPAPAIPTLAWAATGDLCLPLADADRLDKFFDQYRAYRAAVERLRGAP